MVSTEPIFTEVFKELELRESVFLMFIEDIVTFFEDKIPFTGIAF